jgi:cell wall-associated NlpC family hydrolase
MDLTNEQRENILRVAKEWIGTPYRGWGAVKGYAADCGQLVKGIYFEAGHTPADGVPLPAAYGLAVAQHKFDVEYLDTFEKYFREIEESELKPGDVVLYKLRHFFSFAHAAIVAEWPHYVIHATARHGVVGAHGINDPMFRGAQKKFYTFKNEVCEDSK